MDNLVQWIEEYSYDNLLTLALNRVPEGLDKREGSVLYDALAPACYQLSLFYLDLKNIILDTFPTSAIGDYLDLKVAEAGLTRQQATKALNLGEFVDSDNEPLNPQIGSRFSSVNLTEAYIYQVNEKVDEGIFILEAEELGSAPNRYTGELLPVSNINGLGGATMISNEVSGRDVESDEELRVRYFRALNEKAFGGNIVSYIQETEAVEGVGGVQVYPTWDGVGSVGLQIVDNDNLPVSQSLIDSVSNHFDPQGNAIGTGVAPIGHSITVSTPNIVEVDISANVSLGTGATLSVVEDNARTSLNSYFKEIQSAWGVPDELYQYRTSIYLARVMVALLQTSGVTNVTGVKLNGLEADINWEHSMLESKMPVLRNVELVTS